MRKFCFLVAEFLYAFIRGVLKLQCTPVIVVYLLCVALAPLWIRNIRPFGLRKVGKPLR